MRLAVPGVTVALVTDSSRRSERIVAPQAMPAPIPGPMEAPTPKGIKTLPPSSRTGTPATGHEARRGRVLFRYGTYRRGTERRRPLQATREGRLSGLQVGESTWVSSSLSRWPAASGQAVGHSSKARCWVDVGVEEPRR